VAFAAASPLPPLSQSFVLRVSVRLVPSTTTTRFSLAPAKVCAVKEAPVSVPEVAAAQFTEMVAVLSVPSTVTTRSSDADPAEKSKAA